MAAFAAHSLRMLAIALLLAAPCVLGAVERGQAAPGQQGSWPGKAIAGAQHGSVLKHGNSRKLLQTECLTTEGYDVEVDVDRPGYSINDCADLSNLETQAQIDEAAANCTNTDGCVGFNLHGCLKSQLNETRPRAGFCFYTKQGATDGGANTTECLEVDGYQAQPGIDRPGFNIIDCEPLELLSTQEELNAAAENCTTTEGCVGFNQYGCPKLALNATTRDRPGFCFYAQINADGGVPEPVTEAPAPAADCFEADGYELKTDIDYPGNNLIDCKPLELLTTQDGIDAAAENCTTTEGCVGFNLYGCPKSALNETAMRERPGFCFYVKLE